MKPTEAVVLTEYVHSVCPQQHFGEYTADAWYDVLGELSLADCKAAVAVLAKVRPFIGPSEIWGEVKRARHQRIIDAGDVPPPPPELLDNPRAYGAALQAAATALADGRDPEPAMQAIAKQVRRPELEA